jgi:YD repeat-containing protein
MRQIAGSFTLRLSLSLTVCASLLLLPNVSHLSQASQGQSPAQNAGPLHKKPEGTLPDLEVVKNESNVDREAPHPIPSTMRAKRNEGKPWDGRRVGDPETLQMLRDQPEVERQIRRAHASRRATPPPLSEDQFIQNFFSLALLRSATAEETLYWNYFLRAGYNQSQTSLKLAALELGRTLFESASYLARNRDAHWYVYDLYKTYLMRDPDAGGWAYWEALVSSNGREYVRRGFEESGEFATLLATISLSGAAGTNPASLITARVDPRNQPGNGLLSRDVSWSVPLLSLPGRNGLDLGLALSYSSMVWTHAGPYFYFDEDNGFPSPGFRLGFPIVQRKAFDAETGKNAYLLITPAGRRIELRQTTTSTVFEAADSTYLQLTETGANLLVRSTDGTQLTFVEANNEYRCTQIKDRNGNYISVNYNTQGQITNIADTLGRVITFNYDTNANLISITQAWNGQPSHQWVSFGWSTRNMQYSFADGAVIGIKNGVTLPVITQVALNDTSYFTFDYTNPLQVSQIKNYFAGIERNATSFGYETPSDDVPRMNSSSVSAQNWTGVNGMPAQVTTHYSVADGACVLTAPDGTVYKEYYGTGWQKGLTTASEIWSGGVKQKWTTTAWTQDNTSVSYETNPRVTETNVYDASGNRRRTVTDYGQYANWGLPYLVKEYAADGDSEVRRTFTDYNLSQAYVDRRIIGLVSAVHLTNVSSFKGKLTYDYDDPARLAALPASATQHDATYNTSFTARGNLTSVSRWDFTDINNASKKLTSYTNYFVTGTPASATDPASHTSSISYTDAFSDSVNRNTFAYPTTITDADSNSSTVQYNFDFGAPTRTQSPAPAGQSQGAIQTMTYNNLGQLQRVTTANNGAYKRFWYGPNYVASYTTVNNVADELYAVQVVDGFGRVIGATSNHPGNTGAYSLVSIIYDQMGRVWQQSNPTEINSSWIVSGDDAGIYYTKQTYDWNGRPLATTNTDSTTKTASYSGCGCAGSLVTTITDEGTLVGGVIKRRQQKIYTDVFDRTIKTESVDWDGNVYATTVNTYDVRDQVTQVSKYVGSQGSYQDATFEYDGFGRLRTRHLPQQQADPNNQDTTDHTTWTYNADDTVNTITDARGAVTAYGYAGTKRRLLTSVTFTQPGSEKSISYTYDAAGNRIKMIDPLGSTTYTYDSLSRLQSESREIIDSGFSGSGSYSLTYGYNLVDELTSITDPFQASINYSYNSATGYLTGVTGSSYLGVTEYSSQMNYRAWGGLKSSVVGTGNSNRQVSQKYNERLQLTEFKLLQGLNIVLGKQYTYGNANTGNNDGRVKYTKDLRAEQLDRSYQYDHQGRIAFAKSGIEARRVIDPDNTLNRPLMDGPYDQSFGYDAFDHMNNRTWRYFYTHYTGATMPGSAGSSATYTNNRKQGWLYDAEGNVTQPGPDTTWQYTYNAAGQIVNSTVPGRTTLYGYDGDGRLLKETINGTRTYYLTSSLLGGQTVTELTSAGQKNATYVYQGHQLLAKQEASRVLWLQADPAGISKVWIDQSGSITDRIELDALGSQTGNSGYIFYSWEEAFGTGIYNYYQYQQQQYYSLMAGSPGSTVADSVNNAYRGCTLDGGTVPCEVAMGMANRGGATINWRNPGNGIQELSREGILEPIIDKWTSPIQSLWRPDLPPYGPTPPYSFSYISGYRFRTSPNLAAFQSKPTPAPQIPQKKYDDCVKTLRGNPQPSKVATEAILWTSGQEGTDTTVLAVTWFHESSFRFDPPPNPRKDGGYDMGPLQTSTTYFMKERFVDGIAPEGDSFAINGPAVPGQNFTGDPYLALRWGARAINDGANYAKSRPKDVSARADLAGIYRAGDKRTGQYRTRVSEFNALQRGYDAFFDCLKKP